MADTHADDDYATRMFESTEVTLIGGRVVKGWKALLLIIVLSPILLIGLLTGTYKVKRRTDGKK